MTSSSGIIENIIATHGFNNAIQLDKLISQACSEYGIDFDAAIELLIPVALFEVSERKKIDIAKSTLKTMKECLHKSNEDIASTLKIDTTELSLFMEILSVSSYDFSAICVLKNIADSWEVENLKTESTPPFTEGRYLSEITLLGRTFALYESQVVKNNPFAEFSKPEDSLDFSDYLTEIELSWNKLDAISKVNHLKEYFTGETNKVIKFEEKNNTIQIQIPEVSEELIVIDINDTPTNMEQKINKLLKAA